MSSSMVSSQADVSLPSRARQFYVLTKPRVVQLIVFCAWIGMVLAVPGWPSARQWGQMALACIGIYMVAAAAAAFNCLIEQGLDARMKRTAWRPTARGELGRTQTLIFSGALCGAGMLILAIGYMRAGLIGFRFMPAIDGDVVTASVELPYGAESFPAPIDWIAPARGDSMVPARLLASRRRPPSSIT